MSAPSQRNDADRWLRYATEDLHAAESMLKGTGGLPRHACALAQQAAEKAIKAALTFSAVEFPKTHNLDALRNLLPQGWLIKTEFPQLGDLTEWAVESRYPGDWPEATLSDAQAAVEKAGQLCDAVAEELSRRALNQ